MPHELRIGTRGSPLALWQANAVADRIAAAGGPPCRIVTIRTSGDRLQTAPLSEVGGKRLFVKEIEDALLHGEVDVAVHSSKDMTADLPPGLTIAGVLPREDPRDAVVLPLPNGAKPIDDLDQLTGALVASPAIGTGSVRRIAQVSRLLPAARFAALRGNLETRLRKLDAGEYDALILAAAGLRRLGFDSRISLALPASACLPAPGQGIVAIETRDDDQRARGIVGRIDDPAAAAALVAERALVAGLGGGCQTPIGALASPVGDDLELVATVISLDGRRRVLQQARGARGDAAMLGRRVASALLAEGAGAILDEVRRQQDGVAESTDSAAG